MAREEIDEDSGFFSAFSECSTWIIGVDEGDAEDEPRAFFTSNMVTGRSAARQKRNNDKAGEVENNDVDSLCIDFSEQLQVESDLSRDVLRATKLSFEGVSSNSLVLDSTTEIKVIRSKKLVVIASSDEEESVLTDKGNELSILGGISTPGKHKLVTSPDSVISDSPSFTAFESISAIKARFRTPRSKLPKSNEEEPLSPNSAEGEGNSWLDDSFIASEDDDSDALDADDSSFKIENEENSVQNTVFGESLLSSCDEGEDAQLKTSGAAIISTSVISLDGTSDESQLDSGGENRGFRGNKSVDSTSSVEFTTENSISPKRKSRSPCGKNRTSALDSYLRLEERITPTNRDKHVSALVDEFNRTVFNSAIPADIEIKWNARLLRTAGTTYTCTRNSSRHARMELSSKVLDTYERLKSTLLHELCHVAAWLVDGSAKPPHGPVFKKWASRATSVYPQHEVTTCHSYKIHAKFWYECVDCKAQFKRHSKSVDVTKQVCGRCQSSIKFIGAFDRNGKQTNTSDKPLSRYNLFIKEHYASVRVASVDHSETMKILSQRWKESQAV
mmetsp:Transcript_14197/g.25225  ORF Transcript_14197/g.25225 Transcript_14197/m.25225 type:complete len:560 (-) Transcript_14197:3543-5222(-)